MFNVSKKTLSVVLCLALLASVVAVCFVTPASAKKVTTSTTQTVYNPIDQNKITFDSGSAVALIRGGALSYKTEEESGNRYASMAFEPNRRPVFFAKSEDNILALNTNATGFDASSEEGIAKINEAYDRMFKFLPGRTYEISLKYRYDAINAENWSWYGGQSLKFSFTPNPVTYDVKTVDELNASGNTYAENVTIVGNKTANDLQLNNWQDLKITFTVKEVEGFTGAYFSIFALHLTLGLDDYEVKEVVDSVTMTSDYVTHDMEDYAVGALSDTSVLMMNNAAAATIVEEKGRGKVLQMADRGAFKDTNVFTKGKKYYISFDAKTSDGTSKNMWLMFAQAGGTTSSQANPRYWISNTSGTPMSTFTGFDEMFKLYMNGESVNSVSDFKLSGDWQRFGIIVDFTNEEYNNNFIASNAACTEFFNKIICFYFGCANSVLDNLTIVATSTLEDAVPTVTSDYFTRDELIYSNDMSSASLYKVGTATVSNGVVNVTNGRFAIQGSNVITANDKYTISFKAKLTEGESARMLLIVSSSTDSYTKRYMYDDGKGSSTTNNGNNKGLKAAFTTYIDGVYTEYEDFVLNDKLREYTIKFDYTNATFLGQAQGTTGEMGNLATSACYFYIGTVGTGSFDDFEIYKETVGTKTEVSYRESDDTGEDYISAGLRFKASVPTALVESESTAEIGFVVAPSSSARKITDWYELKDGVVNPVAKKGVVYVKDEYNLPYYTHDIGYTDYQLVITGLSQENSDKTAYNRRFSVVIYVKNTDGTYSYRALGEASYYQVLGISEAQKSLIAQ